MFFFRRANFYADTIIMQFCNFWAHDLLISNFLACLCHFIIGEPASFPQVCVTEAWKSFLPSPSHFDFCFQIKERSSSTMKCALLPGLPQDKFACEWMVNLQNYLLFFFLTHPLLIIHQEPKGEKGSLAQVFQMLWTWSRSLWLGLSQMVLTTSFSST